MRKTTVFVASCKDEGVYRHFEAAFVCVWRTVGFEWTVAGGSGWMGWMWCVEGDGLSCLCSFGDCWLWTDGCLMCVEGRYVEVSVVPVGSGL